jgi:hypothetical protein
LSGITTPPVNRNSTVKVISAMIAPATGSSPNREALVSTRLADGPVTCTANGVHSERTRATRSSAAAELGSTAGTTENQVASSEAKRRPWRSSSSGIGLSRAWERRSKRPGV